MSDALNAAVEQFWESHRSKSFSERNPGLGKMINCRLCERRHRETAPHGNISYVSFCSQDTFKGINGAASVAKKRFNPHPSPRNLKLINRVWAIFSLDFLPYFSDPVEARREAVLAAQRELKNEYRKARRIKNRISRKSRKRNWD